jgi:hypothetical protein
MHDTTPGDTMNDRELDLRIAALEARVPTPPMPPRPQRLRLGRLAPVALASVLLMLAATATAAAVVVSNLGVGHPGVENPGQPLAGANLECMTPPEAAAYLASHGFHDVVWQVETGSVASKTGSSIQTTTPPGHGYVVPGSIVDGQLLMVVDQRIGATGTGACAGEPMP